MSDVFGIEIYDKAWLPVTSGDGTLVRSVANAADIEVEKQANESDRISFNIPRGDLSLSDISIGRIIRIVRPDGSIEGSGIITGPLDKDQSPYVQIHALGKSEVLDWEATPWRFRLEATNPTTQIVELMNRHQWFRVNTRTDFADATLTNVELFAIARSTSTAEDQYQVILASTGVTAGGTIVFTQSGQFTPKGVSMNSPSSFNRIRYDASVDGVVTNISVQVRMAINDGGSPSLYEPYKAAVAMSPIDVDRKELGIVSFSFQTAFDFIQAKFLMSTQDTHVSPALRAFELVSNYPYEISAGSVILPTTYRLYTPSFETHLNVIGQIADDNLAEFEVTDGFTLHIRSALGIDVAGTVAFNIDDDADIIRYEEDDSVLTTRLYGVGQVGSGLTQMSASSESTTNQILYGIRTGIFNTIGTTLATTVTQTSTQIANTKAPITRISASYINVPPPTFRFGDTLRFLNPERDIDRDVQAKVKRSFEDDRGIGVQVDFDNETETFTETAAQRNPTR